MAWILTGRLSCCRLLVLVLGSLCGWSPALAQEKGEFVRFPDGIEVFAPGGRLTSEDLQAALSRAEARISRGELGLARGTLDLVETRSHGLAPAVQQLRARIRQVEFSSAVILRDGRRIGGRLLGPFRMDHLGLGTKEEISPDLIRRISAEYHLGWSAVSLTFYPLTLTEVEFRDGRTLLGRVTQEIPITLETPDGRVVEAMMGRAYQLLRDEALAKQLLEGDGDRVARVLVYPALNPEAP